MHIFYCPDAQYQQVVILPEKEMHHAVHVLRLKPGAVVALIDGTGNMYTAEIITTDKKQCNLHILSVKQQQPERKIKIHVAIAPTKSADRFDFFLEKATEIGIDSITPLLCQNSERRTINAEKEKLTIIAAMKQSEKAYLPVLNPLTGLQQFIEAQKGRNQQQFIAHCKKEEKKTFSGAIVTGKDILIMIGPEGDFTAEEINIAEKNNFTSVSLGAYRLRTETAAIAVVQTIHTVLELQ